MRALNSWPDRAVEVLKFRCYAGHGEYDPAAKTKAIEEVAKEIGVTTCSCYRWLANGNRPRLVQVGQILEHLAPSEYEKFMKSLNATYRIVRRRGD